MSARVAGKPPASKGEIPPVDRLLTPVRTRSLRGFLLAFATLPLVILPLVLLALLAPQVAAGQEDRPRVLAVHLDNDINPVTQEYLENAVDRAEDEEFAAMVVLLDTPGGLSSSMRGIVKKFLAATVPVIVYTSPPGSSADSAGSVIAMAADIAAMAPQTNIGSTTPISLGGEDISEDLRRKVVNDAAAYVGELAREHGRNVKAAREMVTKASNYGARQAEAIGLVDVVSPTLPALLREIDGTKTVPKGFVLETAGADIEEIEMSFWQRARDLLVDPNLIALMLSIGLIGIVVELWNPGLVFPGTVGAISLILGLYGLQVLPVSLAGLLLMLLAAGFFVAEAFVPTHGALAVAGGVMFVLGALILFDPAGEAYQVSLPVALAIAGTLTVLLGFALTRVVRVARRPAAVGMHSMVGGEGSYARTGSSRSTGSSGAHAPRTGRRSSRASTSGSKGSRTTCGSS